MTPSDYKMLTYKLKFYLILPPETNTAEMKKKLSVNVFFSVFLYYHRIVLVQACV